MLDKNNQVEENKVIRSGLPRPKSCTGIVFKGTTTPHQNPIYFNNNDYKLNKSNTYKDRTKNRFCQ